MESIIDAGRMASTWKNQQAYSIVVLSSQKDKDRLYEFCPQKALIKASHVLVFVGDHHRAYQASDYHETDFSHQGIEGLLVTAIDTSLVAQNILLAAESMGYVGVFIGGIRTKISEVSDFLQLSDYTYPMYALALGVPASLNPIKPRLPREAVVFEGRYSLTDASYLSDYDKTQEDYAGNRQETSWSERLAQQFTQADVTPTKAHLRRKKLF